MINLRPKTERIKTEERQGGLRYRRLPRDDGQSMRHATARVSKEKAQTGGCAEVERNLV